MSHTYSSAEQMKPSKSQNYQILKLHFQLHTVVVYVPNLLLTHFHMYHLRATVLL